MLLRGHRRRQPWWAFAGWLVAAWQITLGFAIGLPLAYVLLGLCLVLGRRVRGRGLIVANLAGGWIFALTCVAMGRLYLRVVELYPQARRGPEWIEMFSPPVSGYLIPPADSRLWGNRFAAAREQLTWPPEMTLLPGFTILLLAGLGLFVSVLRVRHRVLLAIGVVGTGALGLGSTLDHGYLTLAGILPGWEALRTSGRLMVWISLLLVVLAAGALATVPARWRPLLVVPLILVLAEGVNRTPHPEVPPVPAAVRAATGPFLVLPSDGVLDPNVMLWTTEGFPRTANGSSGGLVPDSQEALRQGTVTFPDRASVDLLRSLGIRSVVVLPGRLGGTPWEGVPYRPVDGLGITREETADGIVYRLS